MKKNTVFAILLSLLLLLTACTPAVVPPEPEPDPSSVESQIALLNEYADVWTEPIAEAGSPVFCVTDLDRNGRLELITSYVEGTGYFSYSSMFEVDDMFETVEPVDMTQFDEESEPDLLFYDKYRCYEEDGVYYYICEDIVRNGYAEAVFYKQYLFLADGKVTSEVIGAIDARVDRERDEDVLKTAYYDDEGHNITREEFAALEQYWFRADAKKEAIRFNWIKFEESDDYTDALRESYDVFGPAYGYTGDDDLFEYPFTFYGMKETVLSGLGDDGMFGFDYESELCYHWTFVTGETEEWVWSAEEEGAVCWLEFDPDGTASFSYTQNGETTRFDDMEVSVDYVPLFDGCPNEDWSVVFRGDETNEFAASTYDGHLTVLWYQGPYGDEEYPALCAMIFQR
jgi:hypothetical protein